MDLRPGTMVTDRVRLRQPLGVGGMGAVWVADHLTLDTPVAVKFILKDVALRNPQAVTRFAREAKAAAQIHSPNVVHIYDYGVTEDGTPYIVMELLQGKPLSARLAQARRLDLETAARIAGQVASALQKAHREGVIHRDIKPDNIFVLEEEGECFVKVLDFGIAKRTETDRTTVTAHGAMVGSPLYMSPEQILSARDVDEQADLWALAVVLYEMLAGTPPFRGDTVGAVMVAIAKGAFTPISQRVGNVPKALDAWFQRAFARDPKNRFASAREFGAELQRAIGQMGSEAGVVSVESRVASGSRAEPAEASARRPPDPRPPARSASNEDLVLLIPPPRAAASAAVQLGPSDRLLGEVQRKAAQRTVHARTQPTGTVQRPPQRWSLAPGSTLLDGGPQEPATAVGAILLVALVARDLGPTGLRHAQALLPSATFIPNAVLAAGLLFLGAYLWRDAGLRAGVLLLSAAGTLLLGAVLAVVTLGLAEGSWLVPLGQLGAAAVPLGFAARSGIVAYEALRDEHASIGMLLVLASIAALAAAVQLGMEPVSGLVNSSASTTPMTAVE